MIGYAIFNNDTLLGVHMSEKSAVERLNALKNRASSILADVNEVYYITETEVQP